MESREAEVQNTVDDNEAAISMPIRKILHYMRYKRLLINANILAMDSDRRGLGIHGIRHLETLARIRCASSKARQMDYNRELEHQKIIPLEHDHRNEWYLRFVTLDAIFWNVMSLFV